MNDPIHVFEKVQQIIVLSVIRLATLAIQTLKLSQPIFGETVSYACVVGVQAPRMQVNFQQKLMNSLNCCQVPSGASFLMPPKLGHPVLDDHAWNTADFLIFVDAFALVPGTVDENGFGNGEFGHSLRKA